MLSRYDEMSPIHRIKHLLIHTLNMCHIVTIPAVFEPVCCITGKFNEFNQHAPLYLGINVHIPDTIEIMQKFPLFVKTLL